MLWTFACRHGGCSTSSPSNHLVQAYVKDRKFDLRMRPKAEEDPVVAASSIVARATWLQQMKNLEDECGETLPKGSGANAKEKAKAMIAERLGAGFPQSFLQAPL